MQWTENHARVHSTIIIKLAAFAYEWRDINPDRQNGVGIRMNIDGECKLNVTGLIQVHASRIDSVTQNLHLSVWHVDWETTQLQQTTIKPHAMAQMCGVARWHSSGIWLAIRSASAFSSNNSMGLPLPLFFNSTTTEAQFRVSTQTFKLVTSDNTYKAQIMCD